MKTMIRPLTILSIVTLNMGTFLVSCATGFMNDENRASHKGCVDSKYRATCDTILNTVKDECLEYEGNETELDACANSHIEVLVARHKKHPFEVVEHKAEIWFLSFYEVGNRCIASKFTTTIGHKAYPGLSPVKGAEIFVNPKDKTYIISFSSRKACEDYIADRNFLGYASVIAKDGKQSCVPKVIYFDFVESVNLVLSNSIKVIQKTKEQIRFQDTSDHTEFGVFSTLEACQKTLGTFTPGQSKWL